MNDWRNHIESNSKVLFGKPVIKGTRIGVDMILEKLGAGYSLEDILDAYPAIGKDDVYACLLFASSIINLEKVEKIS